METRDNKTSKGKEAEMFTITGDGSHIARGIFSAAENKRRGQISDRMKTDSGLTPRKSLVAL